MKLNPFVDAKISKKWIYIGDVNIEYGGTFVLKDDIESGEEWPQIVQVCEYDESCSNRFYVSCGHMNFRYSRRPSIETLKEEFGEDCDPVVCSAVYCLDGVEETESSLVQLGKHPDKFNSMREPHREPDYVLAHNANLLNFVKKEFLDC